MGRLVHASTREKRAGAEDGASCEPSHLDAPCLPPTPATHCWWRKATCLCSCVAGDHRLDSYCGLPDRARPGSLEKTPVELPSLPLSWTESGRCCCTLFLYVGSWRKLDIDCQVQGWSPHRTALGKGRCRRPSRTRRSKLDPYDRMSEGNCIEDRRQPCDMGMRRYHAHGARVLMREFPHCL